MPIGELDTIDWAKEVEAETGFPTREEYIKDDLKTVVETLDNEKGERVRIKSTFKIEKKLVPKTVARRRHLAKFGSASTDPPGPNPAHTLISDDIRIQFIRNRAGELELAAMQDDNNPLKAALSDMHCRVCKQNDHWSKNCPYKDMIQEAEGVDEAMAEPAADRRNEIEAKEKSGRYVTPAMRAGGAPLPTSFRMDARRDENTVRVTNLPEETMDQDLREIFSKVGKVNRIYLAKDKVTGRSKGFAFVTFERRDEAEKAIVTISGHKYDHLILKVEWARQNS